jgi:hypothetical protein
LGSGAIARGEGEEGASLLLEILPSHHRHFLGVIAVGKMERRERGWGATAARDSPHPPPLLLRSRYCGGEGEVRERKGRYQGEGEVR